MKKRLVVIINIKLIMLLQSGDVYLIITEPVPFTANYRP